MTTNVDSKAEDVRGGSITDRLRAVPAHLSWSDLAVYLGFVVVFIYFSVTLSDSGFLTGRNFITIIEQTTPITLMAFATVFVLSAREIDLSIGSVVALAALVGATTVNSYGVVAGTIAGIGVGLLAGLLNGVLVVRLKVPSFLITLGTMELFAGCAELVTRLQDVPVSNVAFNTIFGSGLIAGVPVTFFWCAAGLAVAHAVYRKTAFGQRVLATGDNPTSARSVGIDTNRVRIAVLTLSGGAAALAGLIYTGEIHGAIHTLGATDMLTTLAAVVIGGTSLFGGRGSMAGALVGSVLIGIIRNGLILEGLSASQQRVAIGLIIVVAVAISQRQTRD
ncbi:ABC transporter permease [Nonomuraea sp. M3C6]|uniref:Autoinducer 2 import system permease protein LsrD n=1 Tax=Nonomuraea marmarensis TaxID=3351344 RepID=A0ABW7AHZ3_9ACTN